MAALAGLASAATTLAHGNNLDEIGMAVLAVIAVGVIGAVAWVGGRRDKRSDGDRPTDSQP
jgi:hypothetical protein